MEGQLRELIPFLRDRNPQVRQIALSNLLGHTPKGSPHRNIFLAGLQGGGLQKPKETDIIRDLKLLCRDQLAVAHDAFRALVNLSDSPLLVPFLTEPLFLNFIVSYILNPDAVLADLASMLLSNLTASSAACAALLKLNISLIPGAFSSIPYYPTQSRAGTCSPPTPYPSGEACDVLALPLLIDAFVQGALVESLGENQPRQRRGELHFLSSVFANLSTSPNGRSFFLTPRHPDAVKAEGDLEYPLSKIVVFSEHKDTIRRGGVASAMKNCAFHAAAHEALLSPESAKVSVPPSTVVGPGIDILPYLLLPLAGPEELDLEEQERLPSALQFLPSTKTREPDNVLRLTHVETLLLLCTTRWGREYLRANGVYEVVRGAHANETVDKVSEHIERLVMLLKGDEKAEIEEVGSEDQNQEGGADSEDEDGKIEEI
ncbi:hypothetical protein SERLA73DRAFT_77131 [Serpula lacrymans var. lacrymans S7.3]|uniref:Protein HGH1 homolog n=2 Tax=Serpula lacrymans var. lacrymans TaxID=341189 RepID=F8Q965_SERL3|nr:uncharacterized protein SERLADRAFT_476982 [Serpula lacrymans var. lacrymans S7.9]EGN95120.1 hypothetical protein SERLA73DRAFT_77131 [Serpula lacrymans var. lacrymans S7.3]EGO20605.1 hypothetical protein SERLADRAFT_476982 [Serpula lacrymans var. lacrymans S7.9]